MYVCVHVGIVVCLCEFGVAVCMSACGVVVCVHVGVVVSVSVYVCACGDQKSSSIIFHLIF